MMFTALQTKPLSLNDGRQASAVRVFILWLPVKLRLTQHEILRTLAPFDCVFRLQM